MIKFIFYSLLFLVITGVVLIIRFQMKNYNSKRQRKKLIRELPTFSSNEVNSYCDVFLTSLTIRRENFNIDEFFNKILKLNTLKQFNIFIAKKYEPGNLFIIANLIFEDIHNTGYAIMFKNKVDQNIILLLKHNQIKNKIDIYTDYVIMKNEIKSYFLEFSNNLHDLM